jgi:hypothetical protein
MKHQTDKTEIEEAKERVLETGEPLLAPRNLSEHLGNLKGILSFVNNGIDTIRDHGGAFDLQDAEGLIDGAFLNYLETLKQEYFKLRTFLERNLPLGIRYNLEILANGTAGNLPEKWRYELTLETKVASNLHTPAELFTLIAGMKLNEEFNAIAIGAALTAYNKGKA